MEKKTKCYIYTRVSTTMQVDGYSLDAQKKKLEGYAEFNEMEVAGEYMDQGKSGKNIEGRPAFKQMLYDIETCKDDVSYVLVFKLSRFGRNAADVLSSLQLIQDYGVNLVCVEDGIDSSKESGKLVITILSAVAEIERENILVQTMEGRKQKAREGKWNGGFAPYGYKLVDGELVIEEKEAEAIRIIFDKYVNANIGIRSIMRYLYNQGIEKVVRENGKLDYFSEKFIKTVILNPVYAGKIAYGRRKTEKIKGSRNEYHTVKSDDYLLYDGIHEAIVDEDIWNAAQAKLAKRRTTRDYTARKYVHILSGLVKCPVCGAGMFGNICNKTHNGKKSQYFYYGCKHRRSVDEIACGYKKQIEEKRLNAAVVEVIKGLVKNKKFATIIKEKINTEIDTSQMDAEIKNYKKQLSQKNGAVEKIKERIINIPLESKNYDKKFQTYDEMITKIYDDIASIEQDMEDVMERKRNIEKDKLTADKIYKYLLMFDELYEALEDVEKKELIRALVEEVQIHEERQENGQWLKGIKFKFPIAPDGKTVHEGGLDNFNMFEGVVQLSLKKDTPKIEVTMEPDDAESNYTPAEKATYGKIKEYVKEKHGLKVHTLYIAQIKDKCGLSKQWTSDNRSKNEGAKVSQCTPEKEAAIMDAFKHFGII